jgi:phosphoribosylformylglycinamidine cyclo-ligase
VSIRYADAGVHLKVAEEVTERIAGRLGSALFGGFVPVPGLKSYRSPVLVSSIDGIGTKAKLAAQLHLLDGLGSDIVHHCLNDIAVHGARPLFFMDYLAFHQLETDLVERLVASIAAACEAQGVRLAGGETAEMPSVYAPGHFDIAGAVVGVVESDEIVDGSQIREGDVVLGLPASGLHTNGYSLVQKVFSAEEYATYDLVLGRALGEELLEPHRCYLAEIRRAMEGGHVHGLAHITGGGIEGNLSRIVPKGLVADISLPAELPQIYTILHQHGVAWTEMRDVFNLGIGLIAVCDPAASISSEWFELGVVAEDATSTRRVRFSDDR